MDVEETPMGGEEKEAVCYDTVGEGWILKLLNLSKTKRLLLVKPTVTRRASLW